MLSLNGVQPIRWRLSSPHLSLVQPFRDLLRRMHGMDDRDTVGHSGVFGFGEVLLTPNLVVLNLESFEIESDAALRVGTFKAALLLV